MAAGAKPPPSVLQVFLHFWPTLIFVPAVLTLVATLVVVTGWFDRRDELRAAQRWAREGAVVPRPRTSADPRPWRRRTSCTCSWHIPPEPFGGDLVAPIPDARVHQDVTG